MPTSVLELTPEQEAYLTTVPQDLSTTWNHAVCRHLFDAGLEKLAKRVHFCSTRFENHQLADGRTVKKNLNPCHEGCLCANCAELQTIREFEHYQVLERICPESFTYLQTAVANFPAIYALLRKLKVPIVAKVGWRNKRFVNKIFLLATPQSIPYVVIQAIRATDPYILIDSYGRTAFHNLLRNKLLAADLPTDFANQLIMKQMKRKLVFAGVNQETRKKLFDNNSKPPLSNNFSEESDEKPFCTIPTCVCHSEPYWKGTPEHELRWHRKAPPLLAAAA